MPRATKKKVRWDGLGKRVKKSEKIKQALSKNMEALMMLHDLSVHGQYIELNGERVDPAKVYNNEIKGNPGDSITILRA